MKSIHRFFLSAPLTAILIVSGSAEIIAQEMPVSPEPGASVPAVSSVSDGDRPARVIKMLPNHKRTLSLKTEERNPYARRTPDMAVDDQESGEETESDRIRSVLKGLAVTGRTYGPKGIRLLAGDIIFEMGKPVPYVLEDQTEDLIVENVTDEFVIIGWIDPDTGELTGERERIPYDLRPTVSYILAGQGGAEEAGKEGFKFGVMRRESQVEQFAEEEPGSEERKGMTVNERPGGISEEAFKQGQ